MLTQEMKAFIQAMPKVELHMHLEGSLEPEMMFALAKRNNVPLSFDSVEAIRSAYEFDSLQPFLDLYFEGSNVLQTKQDFFDLTWAYLQRSHADHVKHVEVFFDPQGHTERGVSFATVIEGITEALQAGEKTLGITYKLIMNFLRHLPESSAFEALEQAEPYLEMIDGVGLDSTELGNPPEKFTDVFTKARQLGLLTVAHAGEEGPAEYIRNSIDYLKISRIDHGVRIVEDPALVAQCVASRMPLTVCPLSNVKLCVFKDMREHNILTLLESGLCVTVNSDDPAYFGGYMNDNYFALVESLAASKTQLKQLALNSVEASWMAPSKKQMLIDEITQLQ